MCGITGLISRQTVTDDQAGVVAVMNACLEHRGPDGEGRHRSEHIALAMRRLSIIDLSTGWQPLFNEDRSIVLVANGEVYNFVELRTSLESRGHRFATKSDCETIIHLYEEYGDECVHHLRGMYAFALWDSRKRRVLLVRDRVGEKPLYLVEKPGEIWFCSELRAMVQAGLVASELDPIAVHEYFHFGYIPEPRCPLQGIRKLPAGHLMSIELDPWRIEQRAYWRMEDLPPVEGDPASLIREELERISELIIRSDVPVGVALSGGLDSSIIAVLAQRNYPGTMQAITIGYEGTPWQDERGMARELAAHLKMPIHEVEITDHDMVALFPRMVLDRDEPVSDLSGIGYWLVMNRAHQENLPVMLAGQGGDELFWGYAWIRAAAAATRRRRARHGRNHQRVGWRDYLHLSKPPISYTGGIRWLANLGGLRSGLAQWRADLHADPDRPVFYEFDPGYREAVRTGAGMYTPEFAASVCDSNPHDRFELRSADGNIEVDIIRMISESYLRTNGILQGDRLSMASSVELRLPFVDYRLIETVLGLTQTQPSVADRQKQWLREAVRDIMPPFVMSRRKRGFTPPWRRWGRMIQERYGQRLLDGLLRQRNVLHADAAKRLYDFLDPPRLTLPSQLANHAIILELWYQGVIDLQQSTPKRTVSRLDPVHR